MLTTPHDMLRWWQPTEETPLHTITLGTRSLPRSISFDTGAAAHEWGRSLKTILPQLRIEITDTDGNTVELRENGWTHVNA